jgi:hypothetical protein
MTGKRSVTSAELLAYIKARAKLGKSAINVYNEISNIYGYNEVSFATVSG